MRIITETRSGFDVLRYSGKHACDDDDHKQDERIRTYVEERASAGQHRFLVDIRDLHVVFGSGIRDLLEAWQSCPPSCDRGMRRLAILWKPSLKPPDRWGIWAHWFNETVETTEAQRAVQPRTRFFVEEDRACEFLLAEESEESRAEPSQ